jgi:hypothetical protein
VILADPVLLDVVGEVAFLKKKKKEKKKYTSKLFAPP